MNIIPIQFDNLNVFEFDGFVSTAMTSSSPRPLHFKPRIRQEVLDWLLNHVGRSEYYTTYRFVSTISWYGATLQGCRDTGADDNMPLWNMYSREYRFVFADPAKALLFKLTFG